MSIRCHLFNSFSIHLSQCYFVKDTFSLVFDIRNWLNYVIFHTNIVGNYALLYSKISRHNWKGLKHELYKQFRVEILQQHNIFNLICNYNYKLIIHFVCSGHSLPDKCLPKVIWFTKMEVQHCSFLFSQTVFQIKAIRIKIVSHYSFCYRHPVFKIVSR